MSAKRGRPAKGNKKPEEDEIQPVETSQPSLVGGMGGINLEDGGRQISRSSRSSSAKSFLSGSGKYLQVDFFYSL
jgi:hypothetical protein